MLSVDQSVATTCCISQRKQPKSSNMDLKTALTTESWSKADHQQIHQSYLKFIRLACLFAAFANISVQASPTIPKSDANLPKIYILNRVVGFDDAPAISHMSRRLTEHNNINSLIKRLLSRKSRSSISSCETTLKSLYHLALHVYKQAKDAHNDIRIRRLFTRHLNREKVRGKKWKITYDKLQMLYCDTIFYPDLFEDDTTSIRSGIKSMLIVLQQKLNSLAIAFSPKSNRSQCKTHHSNRLNLRSRSGQRRFLTELFDLSSELNTVCDSLES